MLLVFGAVLFVVAALLSPPYITDKLKGVIVYGSPERTCYREWKDRLKDPWTAYIESSRIIVRTDTTSTLIYPVLETASEAVELIVRAKNEFGAYAKEELYCPMKDGTVDHHLTFMWRIRQ